ncbi:MAG: hypothetical protein WAT74_06255, partial [Flavobacteriales bacterium]
MSWIACQRCNQPNPKTNIAILPKRSGTKGIRATVYATMIADPKFSSIRSERCDLLVIMNTFVGIWILQKAVTEKAHGCSAVGG